MGQNKETAAELGKVLRKNRLSVKAYWGGEGRLRLVVSPSGPWATWGSHAEAVEAAQAVKDAWPSAAVSIDHARISAAA